MDKMEDWTLDGMLTKRRAANGGKPLSAAQEAEVKTWHDKIAELQRAIDDHTAKVKAERSDQEYKRLSYLEELKAQLKVVEAELKAVEELETLTEIRTWVEQAETYFWGEGVPQDYGEAVKWYRKAAEHGDATAQYNLGISYDQGKGISQDYAEAVGWYHKAAAQGYASAQNNLGACYYAGQGVPQDYGESVKWYRKAAEQGHAVAQFSLGFYCYELGNGVPQDHIEAHKWYRKAAAQGHAESQFRLDEEHYQNIVFSFSDLIATHRPLIGDCSTLPYPKKTILYAIEWLMQHYSTMREATTDEALRKKYDGIMPTLSFLVTVLARDWHEIDLEDKPAIAELGKFDSFPDWALPLKLKYIDDEKASKEACEAAIQVMEDKVATKNRTATMSVNPSDPEFGSQNKIFTKDEADAATVNLKAMLLQMNVGAAPAELKHVEGEAKKSLMEKLSTWIKQWR